MRQPHDRSHLKIKDPLLRFYALVQPEGDCLRWMKRPMTVGYGHFWVGNVGRYVIAHRWIYEQLVGPIPRGMHIDHLCGNRWCVYVGHLEAVTQAENNRRIYARKTHCRRGHAWNEGNVAVRPDGSRYCKPCGTDRTMRQRTRDRLIWSGITLERARQLFAGPGL